jgi:hypothetical protein
MKNVVPSHITVLLFISASFLASFLFHSTPASVILSTITLIAFFFSFCFLFVKGGFFWFFLLFYVVRYSTLFHLPPLRFHYVGGCWDRTQDCCELRLWLDLVLILICASRLNVRLPIALAV